MLSRRAFVNATMLAVGASRGALAGTATSAVPTGPLGRPIGVQLYTVREAAAKDLPATLETLAAIGYSEVELAGLYGHSAADFARALRNAGLASPAAHYSMFDLREHVDEKLDDLALLGAEFMVCSFPGSPEPSRLGAEPSAIGGAIMRGGLSLDDWRWNADRLNRVAEQAKAAGVRIAYHNHAMEFKSYEGTVAFDELLHRTDPKLVSLELDCAWVAVGGEDPARYITRHRERVVLLHIKDLKAGTAQVTTTEVGSGTIDWKGVFGSVDAARLAHYFVEQEHFEREPLDSVRRSFGFLTQLRA
jgi:sugar phosphate isomerase/epimerase